MALKLRAGPVASGVDPAEVPAGGGLVGRREAAAVFDGVGPC